MTHANNKRTHSLHMSKHGVNMYIRVEQNVSNLTQHKGVYNHTQMHTVWPLPTQIHTVWPLPTQIHTVWPLLTQMHTVWPLLTQMHTVWPLPTQIHTVWPLPTPKGVRNGHQCEFPFTATQKVLSNLTTNYLSLLWTLQNQQNMGINKIPRVIKNSTIHSKDKFTFTNYGYWFVNSGQVQHGVTFLKFLVYSPRYKLLFYC